MALMPKENINDFRQTELGFHLPREWHLSTLDEIFSIQQGKALSQKNQGGESPKPFLRTANVLWGCLNLNKVDQMDFNEGEVKRLALKPDDLLICEGGDIGRTAIWKGEIDPCYYQNHIHRLRLIGTDVEPQFIMYWMQAAIRLLGLYEGEGNRTTIPNLSKARLSKFLVPLPPLTEQRAISLVLQTAQRAREARLHEIALEQERKAALMEYLFTHGTRGEPTKQTEIGEMPESWRVAALDEISSIIVPSRNKPKELGGQYPWIAPADITQDSVYIYTSLNTLTKESAKSVKNKLMQKNTVLLCCAGSTIGKTAILGVSAYANQQFYGFISKEGSLIPLYLYYIFKSMSNSYYKQLAGTTTLPFFSKGVAFSLQIPLPMLEEQQKIADSLFACDNIISALDYEVRLLDELFRAVLEKLMTGQLSVRGLIEATA
jgi:type I restriction enzyme S subunit